MQASEYTRTSQLDCITIPQAPRLGSLVVEVENLSKSYGDRLLIKDLSFSVPPGGVVGMAHSHPRRHTYTDAVVTRHVCAGTQQVQVPVVTSSLLGLVGRGVPVLITASTALAV